MNELITLTKNSPGFDSYLLGTFSKEKRALPVHTLNVNSSAESVTFKILSLSEIKKPAWPIVVLRSVKVRSFLLVLVPLFLTLTKNIDDVTMRDPVSAVIATVGVILAFIAANLRNDYMDHMKGVDRVLDRSGSRAIQNGWTTAIRVKRLAYWFLFFALLCGAPVAWAYPKVGIIMLFAAVVGVWAQFLKKNSFKYQIGGEISLFLMLGPLLTVGYQLALGGPFDREVVWLGCVWGWAVLFMVHLRNFRNILPSSQAGFKNTVNWLGFDGSRQMIAVWWAAFIVINLVYHYHFAGFYWGFYLTVALTAASANFIYKLKTISSPIGSEMYHVFKYGLILFLLTIGLWVFECLWYLIF